MSNYGVVCRVRRRVRGMVNGPRPGTNQITILTVLQVVSANDLQLYSESSLAVPPLS